MLPILSVGFCRFFYSLTGGVDSLPHRFLPQSENT